MTTKQLVDLNGDAIKPSAPDETSKPTYLIGGEEVELSAGALRVAEMMKAATNLGQFCMSALSHEYPGNEAEIFKQAQDKTLTDRATIEDLRDSLFMATQTLMSNIAVVAGNAYVNDALNKLRAGDAEAAAEQPDEKPGEDIEECSECIPKSNGDEQSQTEG